jgi:hypothetical protein
MLEDLRFADMQVWMAAFGDAKRFVGWRGQKVGLTLIETVVQSAH